MCASFLENHHEFMSRADAGASTCGIVGKADQASTANISCRRKLPNWKPGGVL
jgi:hypothetical protein